MIAVTVGVTAAVNPCDAFVPLCSKCVYYSCVSKEQRILGCHNVVSLVASPVASLVASQARTRSKLEKPFVRASLRSCNNEVDRTDSTRI